MKYFVTVICPIYNEEKFIENCIKSILEQDYDKKHLEVFFIDGMSADNTRKIIDSYSITYPHIRLLDNPQKVVPPALNLGISSSNGDVLIRIDAHCAYPPNYISTLVKYLFQLNAQNVGAMCNTLPAKNTSICKAIAIGASHKFGVGNSLFRTGTKEIIETDTVPFGCYRKEVFEQIGLFDNDLIRNQDDEFNGRLIKNGGKIFLIPELVIDYYARDSIKKMCKMFYQYGLFKPLVNKKLGAPATIRQFFPLLFLLGIVIGGILSIFSYPIRILYISILALYLILSILISFNEAIKHKDYKLLLILPFTFFCIHISYGFGFLKGILKLIRGKKISVQSNR